MNLKQELNLQLFADAGTLVNASGNYVNAYSGETNAFPEGGGMTASMKTFYDTELLENARPELIHTQFARKQALPAGRGKTVEWRKWNTLEDAGALSDQLELHAIDDVILGAAEELGASAGTTQDKLVRNVAAAGTNVQYCDKVGTNGAHTAVTSRAGLDTTAKLTPDEVNKALSDAMNQEDIAVILMTEHLVTMCGPLVDELKLNRSRPLIVEIPDRHGNGRAKDSITRYVREAIGIKI